MCDSLAGLCQGPPDIFLADPITEKAPEKMPCYRNSPVSVQEPVD